MSAMYFVVSHAISDAFSWSPDSKVFATSLICWLTHFASLLFKSKELCNLFAIRFEAFDTYFSKRSISFVAPSIWGILILIPEKDFRAEPSVPTSFAYLRKPPPDNAENVLFTCESLFARASSDALALLALLTTCNSKVSIVLSAMLFLTSLFILKKGAKFPPRPILLLFVVIHLKICLHKLQCH